MRTTKTLGGKYPSYSMVKKWVVEFRRERERVEDYEWSGCPKEALHTLSLCTV